MPRERISKYLQKEPVQKRQQNLKESKGLMTIEEIEDSVDELCEKIKSFARMFGFQNLQPIDDYIENFAKQGAQPSGNFTSIGSRATNHTVIPHSGSGGSVINKIKNEAKQLLNETLTQEINIGTPGNPGLGANVVPGFAGDPMIGDVMSKITNMNV